MMKEHEFMRAPRRGWSATNTVLVVNVTMYVVQGLVHVLRPRFPLDHYLGLSLDGLRQGFIWQLLTFQFLHGGILHLLLNSWGIYVFGQAVEMTLGWSRFLKLYLFSGVIGGVAHVVGGLLFPNHFGVITYGAAQIYIPMVGASAGLYGLIAAFATLYPHQSLTVYLFFVMPVTVSARVLLGVSAGIAVVGMLMAKDNVAHGAHLGGMLAGFAYVRYALLARRES